MEIVKTAAQYVAYFIEGAAVSVISVGAVQAVAVYLGRHILRKSGPEGILESRIKLGHSLSMGLGFLVGAVSIRIVLNYFLMRDLKVMAADKQP